MKLYSIILALALLTGCAGKHPAKVCGLNQPQPDPCAVAQMRVNLPTQNSGPYKPLTSKRKARVCWSNPPQGHWDECSVWMSPEKAEATLAKQREQFPKLPSWIEEHSSWLSRYQERATERCREKHDAHHCKPLNYPACQSDGFGGQQCQ